MPTKKPAPKTPQGSIPEGLQPEVLLQDFQDVAKTELARGTTIAKGIFSKAKKRLAELMRKGADTLDSVVVEQKEAGTKTRTQKKSTQKAPKTKKTTTTTKPKKTTKKKSTS